VAFVTGDQKRPHGTWLHWLRFDDETLRQQVFSQPGGADALESITHYEVLDEFVFARRAT